VVSDKGGDGVRRYYVAHSRHDAQRADRRRPNAEYYQRTKDRIILRQSELRPSTILEIIDCLSALDLHPADHRVERLVEPYRDLTGNDPPRLT
jgi:hypothetical protein